MAGKKEGVALHFQEGAPSPPLREWYIRKGLRDAFPHLLCRLEASPAMAQKAPVPAPLGPGLGVHCSVEAGTGAGLRRISRISTGGDGQTLLGQK